MTQKSRPFTPDALRRVEVASANAGQSPDIYIDPTGSKDTAHVSAPEDLTPHELHSLKVKGAVMAALEGFRRYRRNVTRRFGVIKDQELLFDSAYDKALYEVQQLIHYLPASIVLPELQPMSGTMNRPTHLEDQLPATFFKRAILRSEGINTLQGLADVSDEMLMLVFTAEEVAQIRQEAGFLLRPALQGSDLTPTDQLPPIEQGWTDVPAPDAGVNFPPASMSADEVDSLLEDVPDLSQPSPEEVQMMTPVRPDQASRPAGQPEESGASADQQATQGQATYLTEVVAEDWTASADADVRSLDASSDTSAGAGGGPE